MSEPATAVATTQSQLPAEAFAKTPASEVRGALEGRFSFVPSNFEEAWRFANVISKSTLVPKDYVDRPENIMVAMQMGLELGLPVFAALQNISVVNGRPSVWGDLGKALLLSSGLVEEFEITKISDIKKSGKAECVIKRKGIPTPFVGEFSLEDAKRADLLGKDNYKKYPERQIQWRAFWYAARDGFADVLKGLAGGEEMQDIELERKPDGGFERPRRLSAVDAPRQETPAATSSAPEPAPARASEAATDGREKLELKPAENGGNKPDGKLVSRIIALMPQVDHKRGEKGAAKAMMVELYDADTATKLNEEQAKEFEQKLNAALRA